MNSLNGTPNRSPSIHGVSSIFRALLVASMFVMSVRMWYVQEHIVFLVILFALVVSILANPAQQSVAAPKLTVIPAGLLARNSQDVDTRAENRRSSSRLTHK